MVQELHAHSQCCVQLMKGTLLDATSSSSTLLMSASIRAKTRCAALRCLPRACQALSRHESRAVTAGIGKGLLLL